MRPICGAHIQIFTVTILNWNTCLAQINVNLTVCLFHFFQSGIDINKIMSAKKKLEAKRKKLDKKNAKRAAKRTAANKVRVGSDVYSLY